MSALGEKQKWACTLVCGNSGRVRVHCFLIEELPKPDGEMYTSFHAVGRIWGSTLDMGPDPPDRLNFLNESIRSMELRPL